MSDQHVKTPIVRAYHPLSPPPGQTEGTVSSIYILGVEHPFVKLLFLSGLPVYAMSALSVTPCSAAFAYQILASSALFWTPMPFSLHTPRT